MYRQRLVMLVLVIVASLFLIYLGRSNEFSSVRVARSFSPEPVGWIKVSGDVSLPGMYPVFVKTMAIDVINLAKPRCDLNKQFKENLAISGGLYRVVCPVDGNNAIISFDMITAKERIVLNIPLDVNRVSVSDLESVPGIGPVMARRIVKHRQNNGDFFNVADLVYVDGVGEKKMRQLRRYLQVTNINGAE